MEFNEKLQQLRKKNNLTQEELAEALFVSRTAISKWESGRGYPNIDSLRGIAKLFSVTVDELLSNDELLTVAEEDTKRKQEQMGDLVFGLLDLSVLVFLFLPLFGQTVNGIIQEVSLISLTETSLYLRIGYSAVLVGTVLCGILTLALQNLDKAFWVLVKRKISLIINAVGILVFIISRQPYAAVFLFVFLIIKVLMLIKK